MLPPVRVRQEGGRRRAAQCPCRWAPTIGRARLRRDQGRWAGTHVPLGLVYTASTEGFVFPDLVEARRSWKNLAGPVLAPCRSTERVRGGIGVEVN